MESILTLQEQRCFFEKFEIGGGGGGGGANSQARKASTMKLSTAIVHFIVYIIKQLKFLNFHDKMIVLLFVSTFLLRA